MEPSARSERSCAASTIAVDLSAASRADWAFVKSTVVGLGKIGLSLRALLGASHGGYVEETAFSGVFDTVDAFRHAAAKVLVQEPNHAAQELDRYGWDAGEIGTPADFVVVQADHAERRSLAPPEFPGFELVVSSRRGLEPARFAGVGRLVAGRAARAA